MLSFNVDSAESWVIAACVAIAAIFAMINGPIQERGWRRTAELELRLADLFESGSPTQRDMQTARMLRDRASERVWSSYALPGVIASTVKRLLEISINVSAFAFSLSTVGVVVSIWTKMWRTETSLAFTASALATAITCLGYMAFVRWSYGKLKAEYRLKEDVARREHHDEVGDEPNDPAHHSRHPSGNPATPNESASHAV